MAKRVVGLPRTRLGWEAVALLGVHVVFMTLFQILVASGQRGGETIFDNMWLTTPILIAGASAVVGGVLAAMALVTRCERSFLVVLALLWGIFVATFAIGEVVFPH